MKTNFLKLVALALVISLLLFGCTITIEPTPTPDDTLRVHFIDVGQGDAILIEHQGYIMLIDGGDRGQGQIVVNYLKDLNITHIDTMVGTHPHADHIGGLIDVLQNFSVGEVVDPGVVHTSKTFEDYLTLIDENDIKFIQGRAGMKTNVASGFYYEILHPQNPSSRRLNDASIVIRLTYGKTSFLFTGDAEIPSEKEILERNSNLTSQILKIGHHGSSTSTSEEFFNKVLPQTAIIMVGEGNRYGHPHKEILEFLENSNIDVYRTDLHGTIIITTDGENYSVDTAK